MMLGGISLGGRASHTCRSCGPSGFGLLSWRDLASSTCDVNTPGLQWLPSNRTSRPVESWDESLRDVLKGRFRFRVPGSVRTWLWLPFVGFLALLGGGALPMLQKSDIDESKGYGGFPVSGQWLVCQKQDIVNQHHAKVYGKAPIGAPPMSVPHLDTRIINGEPALLFGPFAGFTTRFLKQGSIFDLIGSVNPTTLRPMLSVSRHNMDLTRYLIGEVFQSHADRVASLRNFFPDVREEDWKLQDAGQRVQIIKKARGGGGKLDRLARAGELYPVAGTATRQ